MNEDHDLDEDLVALVHGELEPAQARAVRARVAADPAARARLRALAATDAALCEALATPRSSAATRVQFAGPLWLAAAVLVVAAVFALADRDGVASAQNERFVLSVKPVDGRTHPVLTELSFGLRWQLRGETKAVHVLPLPPGAPIESLAADFAARPAEQRQGSVPVAIRAVLKTPDGETWRGTLDPRGEPLVATAANSSHVIRSHDLGLETGAPSPYVFGRPAPDAWAADFLWTYTNAAKDAPARWFPDQPGSWVIELHVHSVPPPEAGAWLTFSDPFVVTTIVDLTGLRSDWGEEVDDMRARLVLATGCVGPTPFAIQLRLEGERARQYSASGSTLAAVPQPLHFELIREVRGAQLALLQRSDLAVITAQSDLSRPHAPGTTRTLIASTDFWRLPEGAEVGERDRLCAEFVSRLTAWQGDGSEFWQGAVRTGFVTLPR